MTVVTVTPEDWAAQLVREAHTQGRAVKPRDIAKQTGLTVGQVQVIVDQVAAAGPARRSKPRRGEPDPELMRRVAAAAAAAQEGESHAAAVMRIMGLDKGRAYRALAKAREVGALRATLGPVRADPEPEPAEVGPDEIEPDEADVIVPGEILDDEADDAPITQPEPDPAPEPQPEQDPELEVRLADAAGFLRDQLWAQSSLGSNLQHLATASPVPTVRSMAAEAMVHIEALLSQLDAVGEMLARRERLQAELAELDAQLGDL